MSRLERDWQDTGGGVGRVVAIRQWLVVTGNRWAVTALLTVLLFVSTVLVGLYGPVPLRIFLTGGVDGGMSPAAAFIELLKTIVALVTIVLSINQLAVSPQLGSVGDQRGRFQDSMDLRERAEAILGEPVSPNTPAAFVRALLRRLRDRVEALSAVESDGVEAELRDYVEDVNEDVDGALEELSGAEYGKFELIPIIVKFNVTAKITDLRRIRERHSETLDPGADQRMGDVIDLLELFTVARAYFKVIYIRAEYIGFSRSLVYLGAPALVLTFWATQMYGPGVFLGQTLGVENRLWVVAGTTAVALSPFMLLVSYFSRLATLSESTLFVGPFSAASSESGDEANT